MSGGRLLVGLRDVTHSEKIVKLKTETLMLSLKIFLSKRMKKKN